MQVLDQLFSFCLVLFIPLLSESWVFPFTLLRLGTDLRARIWPKDKPLHTCIALLVPGVCKADSLKAAPATLGRPEPAVGKPGQALRGELWALPLSQAFSRVSWSLSPPTSCLLAFLSVLFFSLRRYGLGAHSKISLLRYMLEISHDKNCSLKKIEVLRDLSVSVTLATEMCV